MTIELPEANEVLPGLWIGTCASCDAARGRFVCINVLENPHTADSRCNHRRIIGADGKVDLRLMGFAVDAVDNAYRDSTGMPVLVHCGGGAERSPLTVVKWLTDVWDRPLDDAYRWLKAHRAAVLDRRSWLP